MNTDTPMDFDEQRARFNLAVNALGGQRATADMLNCSERTVRDLVSGKRAIHTGFLRDISAALVRHAEMCRQLERHLTPELRKNLTEAQRTESSDGRRVEPKTAMRQTVALLAERSHG